MLTYEGSKGHYFVFAGTDVVGSIAKGEKGWVGHFTGAENIEEFNGATRDKTLALMQAAVDTVETIEVDAALALWALSQAVTERGENFIYRNENSGTVASAPNDGVSRGFAPSYREAPTCRYEWNDAPSCGVGVALNLLGVSVDDLKELDTFASPSMGGSGIDNVVLPDYIHLTARARKVFAAFQAQQDSGRTWGHAFGVAESVAMV